MRIAIVGAGAMGSYIGSHLSAKNEVTLIDANAALVEQVVAHGLRIDTPAGEPELHRIACTSQPSSVGVVDLVVFLVKGYHLRSAIEQVAPIIAPETTVLCLQNGWGHHELLQPAFPESPLVMGVSYASATVVELGRVAVTAHKPIFIGPVSETDPLTFARGVADVFVDCGFEVIVSAAVATEIWKKVVLNSAALPTAALTGACAEETARPPLWELVQALAAESVKVAQAMGHDIDVDERRGAIRDILVGAGRGRASMLQDVLAGRRTEIETINGAVVAQADVLGLDAPLNRSMVALVKGLERAKEQA